MSLKIGLKLAKNYSVNFSLPKREKHKIKFIIIHYTGMKKESEAIKRLCDEKSKVSSHYFIQNNGKILNLVPDLYEAWHAGISNWKGVKSLNQYSVGIEINNPGHNNNYKKFSERQISSLLRLLRYLKKKYQINKKNILGHSDIAPNRKKDPGEKFPWKILAKKQLCHWHNLNETKLERFRNIKLSISEQRIFIKNLYNIGYVKIARLNINRGEKYLIEAFQRKFRQALVNGKLDKECFLIAKNLVKS